MRALVTGVAGFIGCHLARRLLEDGHEVLGVDAFTPYYDRRLKDENLRSIGGDGALEFVEADLRVRDPEPFVRGVDAVFHLAAEPGVRASWGQHFALYNEHNVLVTQRLLEASKDAGLRAFVHFSSSSVYGVPKAEPWREDELPRPTSPYGATKLAADHLCDLYARVFDVPAFSLRPFSVYGPQQRPDMVIHRLLSAAATNSTFTVFGLGQQTRSFTHVDDVVTAALAAVATPPPAGSIINIGGNTGTSINELVGLVGDLLDLRVQVTYQAGQPGDVDEITGSFEEARAVLGWSTTIGLREGLESQIDWQLRGFNRRAAAAGP